MKKTGKPSPAKLGLLKKINPKPVALGGPVVDLQLLSGEHYPMVATPLQTEVNILEWIATNAERINRLLYQYGAVLFRGFDIFDVSGFDAFLKAIGNTPIKYTQRSSPRHEVKGNIYTSTDHPADQYINMHNEQSYANEWPLKIVFYCKQPAQERGETPVADSRKILKKLRSQTVGKFQEKGVLYTRNLGTGLGMGWKDVFQVETKSDVEQICHQERIDFTWLDNERLRLRFVRPAVRSHPVTKETVWFNHAFFFNIFSLDETIQKVFSYTDNEYDLPFFTCYGDGTPIEMEVIEEIKSVYESEKVMFSWEKGDILLLDNMLMAHGRNPFKGDRKILVGMLEPYRSCQSNEMESI